MESGGTALLLLLLLHGILGVSAQTPNFHGDSVSLMTPQKKKDGTFQVTWFHRQSGGGSCGPQTPFSCHNAVCSDTQTSGLLLTDQDQDQNHNQDQDLVLDWCQGESRTTTSLDSNNTSLSLRASGCCWTSNVEGKTNWESHVDLDLATRSDSKGLNACPVTAAVSSLRVPQNCFSRLRLLAHDPDGDHVKCRFTPNATIPNNVTLDQTSCWLMNSGKVAVGVHVLELQLEDFPVNNITLSYSDGSSVPRNASDLNAPPLCRVTLQFTLEILPPLPNCESGHVVPMFLSQTPVHGSLIYASVGQEFKLQAQAQAHHASIKDFQVSGPHNMSKALTDGEFGKIDLTLSWTPDPSDTYRSVPVCFTAETNHSQSEMRCVVVQVTPASLAQGEARVTCFSNKMMVDLETSSMPGIDVNYLRLKDPTCSLTSNGTHILGVMSFSTCGTVLEDRGDVLAFKNEIDSFVLPSEVIVRRRKVKIGFSCQFPKTFSISSYFTLHQSDYIFTESSFGSFSYAFEVFKDGNFSTKVPASAYPVEIQLLETLYMGIQAEAAVPNVTLFVESCKATPDDNAENSLSYDLIKNGCKLDETLKVYPSNQTSYNFEVQAFKFNGNNDQVYITCTVILCEPGSAFSRCAQGCLADASRRRRRRSTRLKETVGHSITQGPFRFVGPAAPGAAVDDSSPLVKVNVPLDKAVGVPPAVPAVPAVPGPSGSSGGPWWVLSSGVSTVVLASLFLLTLALLVVFMVYVLRKRRDEDRKSLLVSAWEH